MSIESNLDLKDLVHDLDSIRANMAACLKNLSAERRASNPYAELGFETLEKLSGVIQKLDEYSQNDKESNS